MDTLAPEHGLRSGMKDWSNVFGSSALNAQLDVDSLVAECSIDAAEIGWRKEFVGFDEGDEQRLADLEQLFEAHTDEIVDVFYENLTAYEQTTDVIGRSDKALEQLKQTQSAYLVTQADRVAEEVEAVAAANEEQTETIRELSDTAQRLSQ